VKNVARYASLIAASADRWGRYYRVSVPQLAVAAIILTESSGNPAAVRKEPDGRTSRGLMQVLEGTARELGLVDATRLHDPAIGIDYGVRYFAKQLARYGGNLLKAVAAYNAGTAYQLSTGGFKNQSYVNKVTGWMRTLQGSGVMLFALALATVAVLFRKRGTR
jgi:soluble lytic murein transglycosylase-like protein